MNQKTSSLALNSLLAFMFNKTIDTTAHFKQIILELFLEFSYSGNYIH